MLDLHNKFVVQEKARRASMRVGNELSGDWVRRPTGEERLRPRQTPTDFLLKLLRRAGDANGSKVFFYISSE